MCDMASSVGFGFPQHTAIAAASSSRPQFTPPTLDLRGLDPIESGHKNTIGGLHHAICERTRRNTALLRRDRPRHADRLRARIFGRPPQLGAADAPLRAPLSLRRLQ